MIGTKLNTGFKQLATSGFTGEILYYPGGENIPDTWLECNNQEVSRETYNDLYLFAIENELIGSDRNTYMFGLGDGSTTFNLPDFRELAFVGSGQNEVYNIATHDVYTLGQFKDDQLQEHSHNYQGSDTSNCRGSGRQKYRDFDSPTTGWVHSARAGNVTRGKQKGMRYFIHI